MAKAHYTNAGIRENGTFSVNLPTAAMARETDYCGLYSGRDTDKASLFAAFYGRLATAPMIRACPVNMECELVQTVDFPRHDVFVGRIVAAYCDEEYLTDGEVDFARIDPILFTMPGRGYWRLGERFADAFKIGREVRRGD
jgi:flavin reductase (DIM6/NTAB) family NADH-FMN oxidoreductase RutF